VPVTGVVPIGHGPLRLELGGGVSFVQMTFTGDGGNLTGIPGLRAGEAVSAWLPMITALVGVRYSRPGPGVTAGLSFTPVLAVLSHADVIGADHGTTLAFMPWGGGSIGYQF